LHFVLEQNKLSYGCAAEFDYNMPTVSPLGEPPHTQQTGDKVTLAVKKSNEDAFRR